MRLVRLLVIAVLLELLFLAASPTQARVPNRVTGAAPPPPADLMEFWRGEVLTLAEVPPELAWDPQTNAMVFRGAGGRSCWGTIVMPPPGVAPRGAVLHIGEVGASPSPVLNSDGLVHMYVCWNPGEPTAEWPADPSLDRRSHPMRGALLDLYQAVSALLTVPGLPPGAIGLVGEGVGAAEALALAALRPSDIAFVLAHQPWPLGQSAPGPSVGGPMAYFDTLSFAAYVQAPTLVIGGQRDGQAPVWLLKSLVGALRGPFRLAVVPSLGHQPLSFCSQAIPWYRDLAGRYLDSGAETFATEELPAEEAFVSSQVDRRPGVAAADGSDLDL